MAGAHTRKMHIYPPASPPAPTRLQYIMAGIDGQPIYVNESASADLEYIIPVGYVNETP